MKNTRKQLVSLLAGLCVLVSISMEQVHALNCVHGCNYPKSSQLSFCSKLVKFRSCRASDSSQTWKLQDASARRSYNDLVNESQNTSTQRSSAAARARSLTSTSTRSQQKNVTDRRKTEEKAFLSKKCLEKIQRFLCYRAFPACEFSSEYKLVCQDACTDLADYCPKTLVDKACSEIQFESKTKVAEKELDETASARTSTEKNALEPLQTQLILPISRSVNCFPLNYKGPSYSLWIVGFVINLMFSFLAALGINMQKHSMYQHHNKDKPVYQQRTWLIGMCLISAGSVLDFLAFGLAPMSLLAPLAALTLVWNLILAPRFHGETLTSQNTVATALITVGVVITVIFSSHSTPSYSLEDLLILYKRPAMIYYMLFIGSFLGSVFALTRYVEQRPQLQNGLLHLLCYGALGGTFGGQSVLFAKCTVELLKTAILNPSIGLYAFTQWEPYLIISAMVVSLVCQVTFLNKGLHTFNALLTVPVYQTFWIVSSVFGGLVYFNEWSFMSNTEVLFFTFGLSVTISGIVYLLRVRSFNSATDQVVSRQGRSGSAYSDYGVGLSPEAEDVDGEDSVLDKANMYHLESADLPDELTPLKLVNKTA